MVDSGEFCNVQCFYVVTNASLKDMYIAYRLIAKIAMKLLKL